MAGDGDVTELLARWSAGDADALQQLMPLVNAECHRIAERQMRRERDDHTLTPTALVNELYLRLVDQRRATWKGRAHFFGIAGRLMRRILVDHARARHTGKRGASRVPMSLEAAVDTPAELPSVDLLAIDDALARLAAHDPEQERIVELRFFAGLTVEETAQVIGCSPRTVKREWQFAKAWLFRELHS